MTKKHQLYIADKKDVNLESLANKEAGNFNIFINGSLEEAYLNLFKDAKSEEANFAVIEEQTSRRIKGNFYFIRKLDIYSADGLLKEGIIGTDGTKSKNYSFVKRREHPEK